MSAATRRGPLRRLDDRGLPALGRALRAVGRLLLRVGRLTGPVGRGAGWLARRNPTAVVAVVLAAAAAALIWLTGGDQRAPVRPATATVVPPLVGDQLGPAPGTPAASYLAQASVRTEQLTALPPAQPVTAVVDLTGYLTPHAVSSLVTGLPGVSMLRAYARVPPPASAPVHVVQVSAAAPLARGLATVHATATAIIARYHALAAAARRHPSARAQQLVAAAGQQAREVRTDARHFSAGCGCVFSVVVRGPATQLSRLAGMTEVRVLDPAPEAADPARLVIVPLQPQTTGVVPAPRFAGE